ncbi:hypothetical protein [Rhizobium bangladeshense]|uniref:hypothetical protein n=1 Tax=Rhizobium bangladeshense TaxID=1138189 RepID=UPI001A997D81|nr:hypothetical protein [Rhizobium bangladeshense]MBX4932028.1 hypothetical protein [Rhizobium bangladeshense]MBY3583881.1 hypothetical protein [Rhizobium bangladeshense]QSY89658.1 hypothetical protein J2J98_05835 [Rhizobium bangladeshense]
MDMDFPVGKANWHCDRVEIHCGTHPVEMVDGGQFREETPKVQDKVVNLPPGFLGRLRPEITSHTLTLFP